MFKIFFLGGLSGNLNCNHEDPWKGDPIRHNTQNRRSKLGFTRFVSFLSSALSLNVLQFYIEFLLFF